MGSKSDTYQVPASSLYICHVSSLRFKILTLQDVAPFLRVKHVIIMEDDT